MRTEQSEANGQVVNTLNCRTKIPATVRCISRISAVFQDIYSTVSGATLVGKHCAGG